MSSDDPSRDSRRETRASRRAHAPGRDPRDIVTEYAFRVDPDLLGVPLASPLRRLTGILVDLFVLALLFPIRAALGSLTGGLVDLVVALAVAWVLFRLASPRTEGAVPSAWIRFLLRGAAVVVALVGIFGVLGGDGGGDEAEEARARAAAEVREAGAVRDLVSGEEGPMRVGGRDVSLLELVRGAGDWVELTRAESAEEARPVAEKVARQIEGLGGSSAEVEEAIRELLSADRPLEPWMEEVAAGAAGVADSLARRQRLRADSAALLYARAVARGDSAAADSVRPALRTALAGDRIEGLERRNRELRSELERTERELEEATSTQGIVGRTMDVVTEDLGIGLGWLGLYFTAFLALWRGRTPGKRLLGMRVVQLDGAPLGWWDAFGRFGGYAAGVATGMIGFLQVFWDPNRQALHDRVAGTVVIRDRGAGRRYRPREPEEA